MNREPEFDNTVAAWVDEGADRAPNRFVWAALEDVNRTPQRGAWRVALENTTMHLKAAAPFLGVAAIVLIVMAAYQVIGAQNVGSPGPSATPRLASAADVREIIVTQANAPDGLTVHRTLTGLDALGASETAPSDSPGFVDALLTDFDRDDDHDNGRYGTFAAVFETVADAERAFDAAVINHESEEGWGLTTDQGELPRDYDPDPGLGDESRYYVQGRAYGHPELAIYLWRVDNVLLHAIDIYTYWDPDLLRSIAEGMDARAR